MNRRVFLGSLATATAAASVSSVTAFSAPPGARTTIHFVGMLGFVRRSDGSLLAATPGPSAMSHQRHASFLMARAGSRVASAFGLRPHPGVVPSAFDPALADARAEEFVFACAGNAAFDVQADGAEVENQAPQMAQMHRIAPGKRLRGDLAKWATTTVALQGGRLVNESMHPDANKVWRFGQLHQQHLTDAVRYEASAARVRMFAGTQVATVTPNAAEPIELWVVSAPAMGTAGEDPRRLTHATVLFDYLVNATPIIAECPEAKGAVRRETQIPCGEMLVASLSPMATSSTPQWPEICIPGFFEG